MKFLPNYLRCIVLCFPLLLSTHQVFSQPSFCASGNEKTENSLLKQFKEKFDEEVKAHYDSFSLSEAEKALDSIQKIALKF